MVALFLKFNKRLTPSSLNIDEYFYFIVSQLKIKSLEIVIFWFL